MLHGRTTLSKFIIEEQRKLEGGAELIALVNDIQTACKYIGTAVARGALAGARGSTGVVNVQGDEPEIDPASIDLLVNLMRSRPEASVGTLACPFPPESDPTAPSAVKVVVDRNGMALYFSRSLIPYPRDAGGKVDSPGHWLLHVGIYAYRREFLLSYVNLPPSRLEQVEKLEQLRVLENGHRIVVGMVEHAGVGIDTPEDYEAFVKRANRDR